MDIKSCGPEITWTGSHMHRKSREPEVTWTYKVAWTGRNSRGPEVTSTGSRVDRKSMENPMCFLDADGKIVHGNWYNLKCADPHNERQHIVENAASIIIG